MVFAPYNDISAFALAVERTLGMTSGRYGSNSVPSACPIFAHVEMR
jgi:hypothetical protein